MLVGNFLLGFPVHVWYDLCSKVRQALSFFGGH